MSADRQGYCELPYLSEGQAPEGEERAWGYRLDSERGYLYLAPLSGEEIYAVSDCIDAEGLADKRGLTPRPYRFQVIFERTEEGFRPREGSAAIGLMSGHEEGYRPERERQQTAERLEQFGDWLIETVSSWATEHPEIIQAARQVSRHNRAVDLREDIAVTEARLSQLRVQLQALELEAMDDALAEEARAARPQLSDEAPVVPSQEPAEPSQAPSLDR